MKEFDYLDAAVAEGRITLKPVAVFAREPGLRDKLKKDAPQRSKAVYTWRELVDLYRITEPYIHPILNLEPRFSFAPMQRGVVVRLDREGRREIAVYQTQDRRRARTAPFGLYSLRSPSRAQL